MCDEIMHALHGTCTAWHMHAGMPSTLCICGTPGNYHNHKFSSGPFWTHKIKTKVKYINIFNILHLLSAPASILHVEAILASLVVV